MRLTAARIALVLPFALIMMGCGDDDPVTLPTPPVQPTVTETFTGTLTINGAITHSFVTGSFGTVTSTLTVVTPDTTVLGMALGTWNGISCQLIIAADKAAVNTSVIGNVSSVGNLCVRLYDAGGTLTEPTSYEVQVVHP
jgi:hypothetical protein